MENYFYEFMIIATAHFIALLSPGADFVYIVNSALSNKVKIAIGASVGIAISNGFYITLCLLGYATVLSQNEIAIILIKLTGGGYLIYLSYELFRSEPFALKIERVDQSSFSKELFRGFILSILNPKISIFYLSLFTLAISKETPLYIQGTYGLWMVFLVFAWDSLLIILLSKKRFRSKIIAISNLQYLMALLLFIMGGALFITLV